MDKKNNKRELFSIRMFTLETVGLVFILYGGMKVWITGNSGNRCIYCVT